MGIPLKKRSKTEFSGGLLQKEIPPIKILIGVDGSDQSLEAVRYAGSLFSPNRTRIVLFNVRYQISELFSDLEDYPHYQSRVTHVKKWATEQKADICTFMDLAYHTLHEMGFPEASISIKIPSKTLGVTADIIKESYSGYSALIVGRTGISRFKDWLMKSAAIKLVGKIKHIPVIVVGGKPDTKKLLVGFDGSRGAMRGVSWAGALLEGSKSSLRLYSMISRDEKFWDMEEDFFLCNSQDFFNETESNPLPEKFQEAWNQLIEEGIDPDRITGKFQILETGRAERLVDEAMNTGFGSIVVGRRGLISFIEAFFIGRVSSKVLNMADKLALWVT